MIKTYKTSTGQRMTIDPINIVALSTLASMVTVNARENTYMSVATMDDKERDELHDEILKDWKASVK